MLRECRMDSKFALLILVLILTLLLTITLGMSKRRDLPFQEIVPLNNGIAVINAGRWFNDNIQITLRNDYNEINTARYNKNGIYIFNNLINDQPYKIDICRTDLKGRLLYKKKKEVVFPKSEGTKYIVLIGASIGKNWDFSELPQRIAINQNTILGFREIYDFDKTREIEILSSLPMIVDTVILKECAGYFPRDLFNSKQYIETWVKKLQSAGINPVLATVTPINNDLANKLPHKFKSILEYNDFIYKYSEQNNLYVFDLEKSLRISEKDRHLKNEYATDDGYHLKKKAYEEILDKYASTFLNQL